MPTCSTFSPDMTSLTTSGRKPLRKKQSKMPPQTALDRILVLLRFASPPIGGLLVDPGHDHVLPTVSDLSIASER